MSVSPPRPLDGPVPLDEADRRLINHLHEGFPLCAEPYHEAGRALGMDADEVLARLEALLARGVLTRFGPLFQVERLGGRFVLAALAVPEARYAEVTALVNALPEVAHNYRREHRQAGGGFDAGDGFGDTVRRFRRKRNTLCT